jgi:predicted HicB family RNase H-like nuclease
MYDKKLKVIIIKVDADIHKEVKMRAAHNNITIKQWVLQAIAEKIAWEKKSQ